MELNKEEEAILDGRTGAGPQRAMEIIVSIGDINDAVKLIDVKSVQISGVSYKTIGDAGLDFLNDFSSTGVKTKAFTTLNPAGVDLENTEVKTPRGFVDKQKMILNAYESMGATNSCTCTPYLAGNLPSFGDHIAWAESSAVAYGNSVIGARTNRESAITALASAITGKTPLYGLHFKENRMPNFIVDVEVPLESSFDYSNLGFYAGKHFDGIPLFRGINPQTEELKALSAGLATGKITMFHVEGVTPEKIQKTESLEKSNFTIDDKMGVIEELNTCEEPDIICIGCPHCTIKEVEEVIKANPKKEVWIYTSRHNKRRLGDLEKKAEKNDNIKIIADTCMVVQPLEEMGIKSLGTNSTKCAYYSKNLSGLDVKFGALESLLE